MAHFCHCICKNKFRPGLEKNDAIYTLAPFDKDTNCTNPFFCLITGARKERKTVILLHVYCSKVIGNWLSYIAQEKIENRRYSTVGTLTYLLPPSRHPPLPTGVAANNGMPVQCGFRPSHN